MDDDDFMWDDVNDDNNDEQDGGGSEDPAQELKVQIENQYFEARDTLEEGPKKAIPAFEKVLDLEKELADPDYDGEWGFKALKRLCKLYWQTGDYDKMVTRYKTLLTFSSKTSSDARFSKGINKVLDSMSGGSPDHIMQIYKLSLDVLKKGTKNEPIWFKINQKLAKLLLDKKEYTKLGPTLEELKKSCLLPSGEEDPKKGATLLDIYSIELQMNMELKNTVKTKELYQKAMDISKSNPGILNSKLALVHYCGGRLLMEQKEWESANRSFYEAFHFWEESGDPLRIPCLRYIILANMLMGSKINPFDSPNTKNLRTNPDIKPFAEVLESFQARKLNDFERIIRENGKQFEGDALIELVIPDLWKEMRTRILLNVIKPYSRLYLSFLAQLLHIVDEEVEKLLVSLILDNKIAGQIDQVQQILNLSMASSHKKYNAISKWATGLNSITNGIMNRVG